MSISPPHVRHRLRCCRLRRTTHGCVGNRRRRATTSARSKRKLPMVFCHWSNQRGAPHVAFVSQLMRQLARNHSNSVDGGADFAFVSVSPSSDVSIADDVVRLITVWNVRGGQGLHWVPVVCDLEPSQKDGSLRKVLRVSVLDALALMTTERRKADRTSRRWLRLAVVRHRGA